MRTDSDLITIRVHTERTLTLDRERLETDPVWEQTLEVHGGDTARAITEYVSYYMSVDRFPYQMPSTNGPGEVHMTGLEIVWPNL